jgi:hypothetical protein
MSTFTRSDSFVLTVTRLFALMLSCSTLLVAQAPESLIGKWIVKRELPTRTIACWGEKEAHRLIGTEIEYTAHSLRWQDHTINDPQVTVKTLTAEQYHDNNSSPSANGSQVDFAQLGIESPTVTQVEFNHPASTIAKGTTEIPGDLVLIKNRDTIIFSICNVYFEATRMQSKIP